MRVLLAEDDAVSRRMLEILLCEWGYEPMIARDGDEAWNIIETGELPELVILDWMMPGRDGLELTRRIREITDSKKPVYVILLTSRGDTKDDSIFFAHVRNISNL